MGLGRAEPPDCSDPLGGQPLKKGPGVGIDPRKQGRKQERGKLRRVVAPVGV